MAPWADEGRHRPAGGHWRSVWGRVQQVGREGHTMAWFGRPYRTRLRLMESHSEPRCCGRNISLFLWVHGDSSEGRGDGRLTGSRKSRAPAKGHVPGWTGRWVLLALRPDTVPGHGCCCVSFTHQDAEGGH